MLGPIERALVLSVAAVMGGSLPPISAQAVEKLDFVYVCRDAGAGAYEAFPDAARLNDGRLMCVFYAGYGHVALPNDTLPRGGRICAVYSSDEGLTWSPAEVVYDGPNDDRDPSIAQLSDGQLVCNFFSLAKSPGANPPYVGMGSFLITSNDAGKTWSQPRAIADDKFYCSSPIRELRDGRLILGLYHEGQGMAEGAVTISTDRGKTWCKPIIIDGGGQPLAAETDIVERPDGSLLTALRGDGQQPMCYSISSDGGANWTVAKTIGFLGHCPYFHRTPEGILLLAHRQPATSLHYSLDEGKSWSETVSIDTVGGAYPSIVDLKDGTTLVVYYEEGEGSSIRARRFKATKAGISWLPLD
jgi:sialidase-1